MNVRWAEESWAIILPTRACGGPYLGTTWVGGVPDAESFVEFYRTSLKVHKSRHFKTFTIRLVEIFITFALLLLVIN